MLTNRLGLPSGIVSAIENDSYTRGASDISVTQLISPPYQRKLRAAEEEVEDVTDRIWALFGSAVHHILERGYKGSGLVEKRMFAEVNGWTVSGQLDVLEDGVLSDWKVTSVWASEGKIEWEQQLNLLRVLCHMNGVEVTSLQVIAIYRDWMKSKTRDESYPECQVGVIPVKLWRLEEAQRFLFDRVVAHQQADPPPCTDEERWFDPPVFAVMKKDRKRAIKLFPIIEDAQCMADELGKGHYVQAREGKYKRCESYCNVSHVCPVYSDDGWGNAL